MSSLIITIMQSFWESLVYIPTHPLLFTSVLFFVLFSVMYAVYIFSIEHIRFRNLLLLLFSFYFYYKISGFAIILLFVMASSDFLIGLAIHNTSSDKTKKAWLILSLIINIGSLVFFKYTNFIIQTWFGTQGIETHTIGFQIIMPIGISFFVFKSLSYVFDLYREIIEDPERGLDGYINYLLYVAFFPNIMAGPISKARNFIPQLKATFTLTTAQIGRGFFLILTGAFLKIVISDYLAANFVDRVYNDPIYFSGFETLMATYGAFIWVYADFAGYTNMAIGIALLLGFKIEENFKQPFLANNITDFWRRWHITLAQWLNDYLFTPLNYSFRRHKKWGIVTAIFVTFTLSGLWHGPKWTFVIWGILHSLAMAWDVFSADWRHTLRKKIVAPLYNFVSIFITFHLLMITIVLFKTAVNNLNNPDITADLNASLIIYKKIFTEFNISVASQWFAAYTKPFLVMIIAMVLHFIPTKIDTLLTHKFIALHWSLKSVCFVITMVLIYQAVSSDTLPFIYLDF